MMINCDPIEIYPGALIDMHCLHLSDQLAGSVDRGEITQRDSVLILNKFRTSDALQKLIARDIATFVQMEIDIQVPTNPKPRLRVVAGA